MNTYQYERFQSNEAYWDSKKGSCSKEAVKPSEEELTKQRNEEFAIDVNVEKRKGFQSLIKCFMFLLVAGITLMIHWKIAKKSQVA